MGRVFLAVPTTRHRTLHGRLSKKKKFQRMFKTGTTVFFIKVKKFDREEQEFLDLKTRAVSVLKSLVMQTRCETEAHSF